MSLTKHGVETARPGTTANSLEPIEGERLGLEQVSSRISRLKQNLESVIRGKPEVIDQLLVSLVAGESLLIEDVPGVGKTTLAKALAASLDLKFQRVQCTPDLLPRTSLECRFLIPRRRVSISARADFLQLVVS